MILIIPESEDGTQIRQVVNEVKDALDDSLKELGLERNEKKTDTFYDVSEFVQSMQPDTLLEQTGEEFTRMTNRLWILDTPCRNLFISCAGNEDLWWYRIRTYCGCLRHVGLFSTPALGSRRVHKYLFDSPKRMKYLKDTEELAIGQLPAEDTEEAAANWATTFRQSNTKWMEDRQELHIKIVELFHNTWNALKAANPLPSSEQRLWETRLRFAVNRLAVLGFEKALAGVVEVILSSPWVVKDPSKVIEALAQQDCAGELLDIFAHYRDDSHRMNEYMRATVLRALRFLQTVHTEHWDLIVEYAIQGTLVECLMATETWLLLSHRPGFQEQGRYTSDIEELLLHGMPARLAKNYVLLLSQYDSAEIPSASIDDAPVVRLAHQIGRHREVSELISYVEPSLIREDYYGGRQVSDSDLEYPT